jgi:protein-tyrosine phosphatase
MDFKDLLRHHKLFLSSKIYPGNSETKYFYLDQSASLMIERQLFSDPDKAMKFYLKTGASDAFDGWRFWRVFDRKRGELVPLEHLRASILSNNETDIKTSDSHPLRLDAIEWPGAKGKLGLTICPGKQGQGLYSGIWQRDLQKDFDVIADWPTSILITLMESHEFSKIHVNEFEETARAQSFSWLHLPIEDMHVPDVTWMNEWPQRSKAIRMILDNNQNIVVHCRGGLGRTGVVAALLLIDQGLDNVNAIKAVREVRPGAIETYEQEQFVLKYGS